MELSTIITAYVLIIGTYISYSIQYLKLVQKKTNEGISHDMILFGCLSGATSFLGIITSNWGKHAPVPVLPAIQLSTPWVCMTIFYMMFRHYAYKNRFEDNLSKNLLSINNLGTVFRTQQVRDYESVKRWVPVYAGVLLSLWAISFLIYLLSGNMGIYSQILNVSSATCSIGMWFPQLWKSYKHRGEGSLSLIALSIHCAGCVLTVIYQLAMAHQDFLVGFPYLIGAMLEGSIIFVCLYYRKENTLK